MTHFYTLAIPFLNRLLVVIVLAFILVAITSWLGYQLELKEKRDAKAYEGRLWQAAMQEAERAER